MTSQLQSLRRGGYFFFFFFLPAICIMMLDHELFPAGIRESVKIYKLLPDAGSIFHSSTLGEKEPTMKATEITPKANSQNLNHASPTHHGMSPWGPVSCPTYLFKSSAQCRAWRMAGRCPANVFGIE